MDVSVFLKELSCYRAGTVLVIFVSPVPGMDVVYSRYLINNMQEAKGMLVERYSHSDWPWATGMLSRGNTWKRKDLTS